MKAKDVVIGKQYRYFPLSGEESLVTVLGTAPSSSGYAMRRVRYDNDLISSLGQLLRKAGTEGLAVVKKLEEL